MIHDHRTEKQVARYGNFVNAAGGDQISFVRVQSFRAIGVIYAELDRAEKASELSLDFHMRLLEIIARLAEIFITSLVDRSVEPSPTLGCR